MVSKLIINCSNKEECGIDIKNRSMNSAKSPEMKPHMHRQLTVKECSKTFSNGERIFQKAVPEHCAKATKP